MHFNSPRSFLLLPLSAFLVAGCTATPLRDIVSVADDHPSDHRPPSGETWRSSLVDPVSSPTTFESPIIETNIEPVLIDHTFPSDSIFGGGGYRVIALQVRYALTERLAIIATKDGWIDLDPDVGSDESGLADIGAGLKYALIDDQEQGLLVTPGFTLELTTGDKDVFQGNGDGLLRAFVSAAKIQDSFNVIANVGYSQPLEASEESASLDYHLHFSRAMGNGISPLLEINGISYTHSGDALGVNFEGGDLINLGATNVSGNTFITGAIGARWRATPHLLLGLSFETPIGGREDLMDRRITLDAVIH